LPILSPINLPKIKKYKAVVIAGGNKVCGQIRVKRRISLNKIVVKAME
jgi:hypothetical protein